jgi:short-subunit dehydrogenase
MDFYRGTTALVTGASAGFGEAFARRLAAAGSRVVLVARSEDRLRAIADEIGGGALVLAQDLEARGAAATVCDRLAEQGVEVDVLINNAGFGLKGRFLTHDPDALEAMVALNSGALTGLMRRLLPGMVARRRGGVLNLASMSAYQSTVDFSTYAATKAYVLSLSQAVHYEVRGTGVHVSCLLPGPIPTSFGSRASMDESWLRRGRTSDDAARAGLDALARNRREVALGLENKLMAFGTRLAPHWLVLHLSERYMRSRR